MLSEKEAEKLREEFIDAFPEIEGFRILAGGSKLEAGVYIETLKKLTKDQFQLPMLVIKNFGPMPVNDPPPDFKKKKKTPKFNDKKYF